MRTQINRHENSVKNYATIEVFITKGVLLVKFRKCSYSLVCMLLFLSLFISMATKTVKTAILDNSNQGKKKKNQPHCKRRQLRAKTEVFR